MVEKELLRIMDHNFEIMDRFINESKMDIHKFSISLGDLQKLVSKNQQYCRKLNYLLYGSLIIGAVAFVRSASSKKQVYRLEERIEQLENKKGA